MRQIRLARPAHGAALRALQRRLNTQSSFMLLEPGEREQTPQRLREWREGQGAMGSFDLVAATADKLAGWLAMDICQSAGPATSSAADA